MYFLQACVSYRRVPYSVHLIGVHLIDVHLIDVHLIDVHLIDVHLIDVHLIGVNPKRPPYFHPNRTSHSARWGDV